MLKKLAIKKWVAWMVLALVVSATGYLTALKYDVLSFAVIHTEQVRFAKERYELAHKQADKIYMEVMASPVSEAK